MKKKLNIKKNLPIMNELREPEYFPRHKVYTRFKVLLESHSFTDAKKLALNIEIGIFNYALSKYKSDVTFYNKWNYRYQRYYIDRAVTIFLNLDPNSVIKNTSLLPRLFNKEFKEHEMCFFTPQELWSEKYKDIQLDLSECMLPKPIFEDNGIHKCGKCFSYKTVYSQLQCRSGDESSSIFVTCECGHAWKYNP